MAAKFKTSYSQDGPCVVFWEILIYIYLLFGIPRCLGQDGLLDTPWLTDYKTASAILKVFDKPIEDKRVYTGRLTIKSYNQHFTILLYGLESNDHVYVSVDGEDVGAYETSNLGIYDGLVSEPCCGYKATVKVTSEGIDAIIHTANTTYILEPMSRFIIHQFDYYTVRSSLFINDSLRGVPGQQEYKSVLYTASDVIHNFTMSTPIVASEPLTDSIQKPTRVKRSDGITECTIHMVSDDTFYRTIGHSDVKTTLAEMMYYVREANVIFRSTDFDGDGSGDNIGVYVSRVTIFTSASEHSMSSITDPGDYLSEFSKYDFEEFCLATAFTSKDFSGTLGMAYLASSNVHSAGGICSGRSGSYNLNTNFLTTHTRGKRMPVQTTVITLTHEYGHSFGSPHDSGTDCAPGGQYGNFIMYPYAVDGSRPNNRLFSSCAVSYIYPVLRNKNGCFKFGSSNKNVCGNGIKENDEECDCGSSYTCDEIDPCCTPRDDSNDTPCTIRRSLGHECSPASSPCCDSQCKVLQPNQASCRAERDCSERTFCDGISAECPSPTSKPNGTECYLGAKTCINGQCTGSICDIHGQVPCDCVGQYDCYICCRERNGTHCTPTVNHVGQPIYKHQGQSCDGRHGFCDGHGECISKNHGNTIDNLNEVFTEESIKGFKDWMGKYWYYVLAAVLALIFLIVMFIFTCKQENVHTSAYMHGQFGRIQREAELQKEYLERRKAETKSYYDGKLRNLDTKADMSLPTALSRMITFFPTAPRDILMQTLKTSANEEAAVKLMILRNYPFRRICISKIPKTEGSDSSDN